MVFFQGLALLGVIWGIVSAMAIGSYLAARGEKINHLLFRFQLHKHLQRYLEITHQEEGKPGNWYYSFIISMSIVLVCILFGLALL
jgi:hypothetical protein